MRVLVVGSGGREHALAWKLSQEAEVLCAPGNPGIAQVARLLDVQASDQGGLAAICHRERPDLVVVGPEDPLVAGLGSFLRREGFAVFGPNQNAAQLEASKAWSKAKMAEAGVPTAAFGSFEDPSEALTFATSRFEAGRQVAVKASGNALGKGVVLCHTLDEAEDAIAAMMIDREFGDAGATVVVEDRLEGREFSLLTVVSGPNFLSVPIAQDYKRALDGDRGPNTGGMGSVSPCGWVSPDLLARTEERVVAPMVRWLHEKGIDYRGVLFSGVMVVDGEPYCLEYNVRFGDPETQSVVRRLGEGFADVLLAAAEGRPLVAPKTLDRAVVSVVVASGGYPGKVQKGLPIQLDAMPEGVEVFHAGTAHKDGQLVTNGGRVLAVSAIAESVEAARSLAYEGVKGVKFEGMQYRSDIGAGF